MKKPAIISAVITTGFIGIVVGWWLVSPLFINKSVAEEFPFDLPGESKIADESVANQDSAQAEQLKDTIMAVATTMSDTPMKKEMPASVKTEWKLLSQGQFKDADRSHKGSGRASIIQLGDQRVLRFDEFKVTNGPDLHVLLVEHLSGTNHTSIGKYVDLGSLKGNLGSQNYEIMAEVDLSQFEGVMIYCMPFHVVFSRESLGN